MHVILDKDKDIKNIKNREIIIKIINNNNNNNKYKYNN